METLTLEREPDGAVARGRLPHALMPDGSPRRRVRRDASGRDFRDLQVRLSRVRRRGVLESGEAEARLPVLRDRVARQVRRGAGRDRRARSRHRASRHRRRATRLEESRSARCAARAATRSPCSIRSARRRTASSAGRRSSCPTRRRSRRSSPESVLPFAVARRMRATASASGTASCGSRRIALKRSALTDTVQGHLPSVLDVRRAACDARWTAEAGHYYYTTETYSEDGQTRTRQVRHVRWEPAAGALSHFFDDDLVCASVGVHPRPAARHRAVPDAVAQALRCRLRRGLGRRALPDRPRRRGATRARDAMEARLTRCARSRSRATPIAISRCARITPARRSSTSWRPCGS